MNAHPLTRLLICEGYEDAAFFRRLIDVKGLPRFIIIWAGGNTRFKTAINTFYIERTRDFRALDQILFVADNDEDPATRFSDLRDQINTSILGAGAAPNASLAKSPRTATRSSEISILMVPWAGEKGHLEKMCIEAARDAHRPTGTHVDTFMDLIHSDRWNNESRHAKAWLRASLAARCERDPFVALGDVFSESRYQPLIPVDHPSFVRIANFLSAL
ncbi:hypothetical protein BH10PSE6_BH10PSE6_37290 [soil metagenome]